MGGLVGQHAQNSAARELSLVFGCKSSLLNMVVQNAKVKKKRPSLAALVAQSIASWVNGLHGVIAVRHAAKVSRKRHEWNQLPQRMVANSAKVTSSKPNHALPIHVQSIATSPTGWKFYLVLCLAAAGSGRRSEQLTSKRSLEGKIVQLILFAICLATWNLALWIASCLHGSKRMVAVSHVEGVSTLRKSSSSLRWLMGVYLAQTSRGRNISIATHIPVQLIVPSVCGLVGRHAHTPVGVVLQPDPG
jgi:hypothetical protein